MKKIVVILVMIAIGIVAIGGCSPSNNANDPKNVGISASAPVNYGNGVYYFPVTKANFANALSGFLRDHPEMKVSAIAGDGDHGYGIDQGYFVIFEKR